MLKFILDMIKQKSKPKNELKMTRWASVAFLIIFKHEIAQ